MYKSAITIGIAAALLFGGLGVWRAEAMIGAGAAQISTAAKAAGPVGLAACARWGAHCPPGYTWNGARCVPC
jgi:hypothetical protein